MRFGVFLGCAAVAVMTALQAFAAECKGMVRIPAGSNRGEDPDYGEYEVGVEEPFHMDATEVTWGFWREVRAWALTNGYEDLESGAGKGDAHPVQNVSWFASIKWCNARSEREGLAPCYTVGGVICRRDAGSPDCSFSASGYRLPTHDEWEYAARGGLEGGRYPWGDTISHKQANYYSHDGNSNDVSEVRGPHPESKTPPFPYTLPVASFEPNAFGLYDMAGNVWEWCWAPRGASRAFRGGSWDSDASGVRCGYRSENSGNGEPSVFGGLRCVRRAGQ